MISDSERLLNWRNAPTVRQSAFNTAEVLKEEHEMWFQTTLADSDVRIYILELGCIPVGQIRINRVGAEVHDDTRMREDNRMDDPRVNRGARPLPECEEVCGVLRLVPWVSDSNETVHHGKITKRGPQELRTAFVQLGHGDKALQGHRVVADGAAL